MGVLIDETGKRYGRLFILRRNGTAYDGNAAWLCQCDCGNETTVSGRHLRRGDTKSCGCLGNDVRRLPGGESAFNVLLNRTYQNAKNRGYTWKLTREQVRVLSRQPCYYCGKPPRQIVRKYSSEYIYNGIDRMDNEVGYVVSNCVSCCKECNYAKGTRTAEDFITWAIKIADKHREIT